MKAITEMDVKVTGGRIIKAHVRDDGSLKLVLEVEQAKNKTDIRDYAVRIEASKLSLTDKFMQYEPKPGREQKLKDLLTKVIKKGIKDFWRPRLDPSFNDDGSGICYKVESKPAVGKSYNWWKKVAKDFDTKRRSRLGTKSQYVAFLGVLIKALVNEGWKVEEAWDAVCQDSKKLGHYWNSEKATHKFEPTGSREICGFFDLGNTFKILAEDEDEKAGGFWLAGGNYDVDSDYNPLGGLYHDNYCNGNDGNSVGWLVLEEGSTEH